MSQKIAVRLIRRFLALAVLLVAYTMVQPASVHAVRCCSDCEYEQASCAQDCGNQFPNQGCPGYDACMYGCTHNPQWSFPDGSCWRYCNSCFDDTAPWVCWLEWACGNSWCYSYQVCV